MSQNTYDVIVVGLGGMGSAAAYHLARRGRRVLGLDRYSPGHTHGSSHGHSRIIRQAYFEDPAYVPLVRRAYDLWRQLETESGETLLTLTGGLMLGRPESEAVAGSLRSAREHDLPHEVLDAAEIRRRFPPFQPSADTVAVYEAAAGFVRPERAVRVHLAQAARHGADLHFDEPVDAWEADGEGVCVRTARGSYTAGRLILAPGPWAPQLLAGLHLPLSVERRVLYWFRPVGGVAPFLPDRFPIFLWEEAPDFHLYGFPSQEGEDGDPGGVKVAYHQGLGLVSEQPDAPEATDRRVAPEEVDRMRESLAAHLPALNGPLLAATTCLYTKTPDGHFLLDRHPAFPTVAIASPCSGHGYKFCSVIGEILADLATTGETRHPISPFSAGRFTASFESGHGSAPAPPARNPGS